MTKRETISLNNKKAEEWQVLLQVNISNLRDPIPFLQLNKNFMSLITLKNPVNNNIGWLPRKKSVKAFNR